METVEDTSADRDHPPNNEFFGRMRIPGQIIVKKMHLVLLGIFLMMGLVGFSGSNNRLAGPPFGDIIGQDFRQVLRAAEEIRRGDSPYTHAIQFGRNPNFAEFVGWEASTFPYPPIVAIASMPLLAMDTGQAVILWTWLNWLFIVIGVISLSAAFRPARSRSCWRLPALSLIYAATYGPLHIALKLVQLDILLFFLLSLTFLAYRRHNLAAGLFLGAAIAVKPLLAPLLFFFLWKREWRIAIGSTAVAGFAIVGGFVISGWDLLPDYVEVNRLWTTSGLLSFPFNQSVNGLALRLFTVNIYVHPLFPLPILALILRYGAAAAAVAIWLWLVSRSTNPSPHVDALEFGLTLTTIQFLSPLVDDCHYVWTLIPILALLFAWIEIDMRGPRRWLFFLLALITSLYLAHPDLHDAIYRGWEILAQGGRLLDSKFGILTGAYVYGLGMLELCLFIFFRNFKNALPRVTCESRKQETS